MRVKTSYIIVTTLFIIAAILIINPSIKRAEISLPDGNYTVDIRLLDYLKSQLKFYAMEAYRLENIHMDEYNKKLMERIVDNINIILKEDQKARELYEKLRKKYNYMQICQIKLENVFICGTLIFYPEKVVLSHQISAEYPTIMFKTKVFEYIDLNLQQRKYIPIFDMVVTGYKEGNVIFSKTNIFEIIDSLK